MGSQEGHEELARYYRFYRGAPAPANNYTERLWRTIEAFEAHEGVHG